MSLDGALFKIVWAQKHLDALKLAIREYEDAKPYVISVEKNLNGIFDGVADITKHPGPPFSAIIGDCIHNLMSSLDYVIWELAGTFANRPLVPPPAWKDRPYFPIFDDSRDFSDYVSNKLNRPLPKGPNYMIPDPVIAVLNQVQPYQTGYERLSLLKTVDNVDKHRLLLVTKGKIDNFGYAISGVVLPGVKLRSDVEPQVADDTLDYAPKMNANAAVYITWADPSMPSEPVTSTLRNFVELLADIVPGRHHHRRIDC